MMQKLELKNIRSVLSNYDAFLFDLWGVIVEGEEVYEGVIETINSLVEADKKCLFVSNAPRPSQSSLQRIRSWGVEVKNDCVFTSGEVARQLITSKYSKSFHLGSDRNKDFFYNIKDLETKDVELAEAVVLTLYRDEGEDLTEFDHIIEKIAGRKIPVICANPDTIIPLHGKKRYCSGYFAQKLERLGSQVIYTGKPELEIYNQVLAKLEGIDKKRILMIGDTFETDILGANKAGIHSALVLTGNAKKFHISAASMTEKLTLLEQVADNFKAMPNFVIEL